MPKPGAEFIQSCPMCESTFDSRKHGLVICAECSGEGSTACCIEDGEVCQRCHDAQD